MSVPSRDLDRFETEPTTSPVSSLGDDVETARGEQLDRLVHRLVNDLHTPWPAVFWSDLLSSAALGWGAFAVAVTGPSLSLRAAAASLVAAFALYRGLCFVHELTHLRARSLPGLETVWNLLFGVPLLLPSFTYLGVHQDHHSLATYGTKQDPEYLPFAASRWMTVVFVFHNLLLLPLLLLVRFLILAPVGLMWPRFHQWLAARASSFAMNPAYRRNVPAAMARKMWRWEAAIVVVWAGALTLIYSGVLPYRSLILWYAVLSLVSLLNSLRVLGAHDYETDGTARDRQGQLSDSIDTPGAPWTELWAPVGLRYHALHHYFPGIPYHSLGTAYRRLARALPGDSLYRESTSPSLRHSLTTLYEKARRKGAGLGGW